MIDTALYTVPRAVKGSLMLQSLVALTKSVVRNNPVMAAQYGHLILRATPPARASNNALSQQASLADTTLATTA